MKFLITFLILNFFHQTINCKAIDDLKKLDMVVITNVSTFIEWVRGYKDIKDFTINKHVSCKFEEDVDGLKCTLNPTNFGSDYSKIIIDDEFNSTISKFSLIGSISEFVPGMSSVVAKFPNLTQFDAGWVGIKEISRRDMNPMKNFTWVSFWGNKLEEIPLNTFADLTKLEKLILGQNKLKSLHPDTFVKNVNLREIWLQENQLQALPKGLFANNLELSVIYAEKNEISTIKIDFLSLTKFNLITLMDNECINAWCDVGDYCGTGSKEKMQQKILMDC